MKKSRLSLLLPISCCMMLIHLTYPPFEEIDQMVPVLAGDHTLTIAPDAGHGGEGDGAASKSGIVEKDINLAAAMDLEPMFEMSGFRVVMVRDSNVSVGDSTFDMVKARETSDMYNRLEITEENGDCVSPSVHQNHFTNGKYSGAQTFYGTKNSKSQALVDMTQKTISTFL